MSDHSEESQQITLEQYLDSRDRYRSTNLPDLWPNPLKLTDSTELQETILPIRDDIRAILRTHGLPEHVEFLPYVARKPGYQGGDTAVNLLRVVLHAEDNHPRCLGPAKDDIVELLHEKKISDMFVEIVNVDLCYGPSLFALPPGHPLVVRFEEAKQRITLVLELLIFGEWCLLCPFNIGHVESKARPALVIYVTPGIMANWDCLATEIQEVLGHCDSQTVEVEFLPGGARFL